MVTYTLFLYLNVITFCFQSSLCRSMKGLEPLCASTATASVQSLTIHFHCGHVICKNSLQGLLDVCIHCFHNRYPFFTLIIRYSIFSSAKVMPFCVRTQCFWEKLQKRAVFLIFIKFCHRKQGKMTCQSRFSQSLEHSYLR